ncbi:TolC family protein [Paracnuella aquatica]|uniref:TolC family protein n=1 Tax=Paracnuella aquatica TaxID=2268757 RepID=UPI000DEF4C3B|nr:TolC family protein [Paracnuella aquatica]RPD51758.1 TolC family protein [Paracnuella aquatica]
MQYKIWSAALVGLAAATITGCAPMKELQPTEPVALPQTFTGGQDSASMAQLSYKQLFADANLQQLIDTALRNNWDLLSALQRVEMARAGLLQAGGALRPQVSAGAAGGGDRWGRYTLNGVGNFDTNLSPNIDDKRKIPNPFTPDFFLGLRSSWELDIWGRLRNLKEAASLRVLQSQRGVQFVRTVLVAEVANHYYELLALDNQREILRKNMQLQERAVEIVEAQKEGGRATELAVQQFRAQLLNTRSLDAVLRQRISEVENNLNLLCGRLPQTVQRSNDLMQQQMPQMVAAGVPSDLLLRRPDISQAELELRALEADVSAARKAFLPALTLTPYVGFNSFNAARLFDPASLAAGAVGGLAAPIINRAGIKADYNRADAARKESLQQYYKTTYTAFTEVVTTLNAIKNLDQKFAFKEEETTVLENAVVTANDLYLSGRASYLEVITAQRSVIDAELELVNTRRDMFLSVIELYRSLGGGWQ